MDPDEDGKNSQAEEEEHHVVTLRRPPKEEQQPEEPKGWDLFEITEDEQDEKLFVDGTCYAVILQSLKILAYIITFLVVLGGAVSSKIFLLLITSQLLPGKLIQSCNGTLIGEEENTAAAQLPTEEKIYWTWIIIFAFWLPELFTLFRSLRICIFKGQSRPNLFQFGFLFLMETLHTIGLGLFVFTVLPSLDVVKGAVLFSTVCIIPCVLALLSRQQTKLLNVLRAIDAVAFIFQFSSLFLWLLYPENNAKNIWILPISILLISFGWWSNFIELNETELGITAHLQKFKQNLIKTGYFSYVFISLWKIILFFLIALLSYEISWGNSVDLITKSNDAFKFYTNETEVGMSGSNGFMFWEHPLLYQVISAFLCYIFGKFACKICIQHFSFALPLTLAVPATISLLVYFCNQNTCFLQSPFFGDLKWTCPTGSYFGDQHAWSWILYIISYIWITIHIWFPPSGERLARTETMFESPMYCGLLVDQSLALNRIRKDECLKIERALKFGGNKSEDNSTPININEYQDGQMDHVPKIYACATMWHENKEEMIAILKSIFRMDEDQCSRKIALNMFDIMDIKEIGYYEYETHIFFDDAFQLSNPSDYKSPMILNTFVQLFITCVNEASNLTHNNIQIRPPLKYPTPYGGRLEYTLPGETKLIAHLKDKSKIRHRKRWSQVMYMYYFLGNRLMDLPIPLARKEIIAQNTFLLALDGDVDFKPKAVELLLDLMKKNLKLGAACGRIHPTGGGPMVWYQKFEYATGHWFQKATEHMLGAVLCSPGCFSLFRGSALMNENVMAKYTTNSDEAIHYVQYDQGEDRWLCTLLLQQGYRVDYSAASDAYTHAPEDFNEFYNQRRRWVPSTTANIMDLLVDYRRVIRNNVDISIFYIAYQCMLMFGTIMGPGTIFLMLVGAFTSVFGLTSWTSFTLNIIPILAFSLVCYFAKSDVQLKFAQILSVVYALVMVGVIVGIAVNSTQEGIMAPSSIFLVAVAASFIITAMLHPLEFDCLLHGLLYFIIIPSMYLLLMIFSIFNLNNVSWGTREGPKIMTKEELQEAEKRQIELKKKQDKPGFFASFLTNGKDDDEGSLEFSCAGLFKCMCCTHKKTEELKMAASLEVLSGKLEKLDRKMDQISGVGGLGPGASSTHNRRTQFVRTELDSVAEDVNLEEEQENSSAPAPPTARPPERPEDPSNPTWISDKLLLRGQISYLPAEETEFWTQLIAKYLYPIDANPVKEAKLAEELIQLRNKSVFYFFLLNSIFVLLIFLLELQKETISIDWPFGDKNLKLEPIATVFLIFFALILIIQFIAMLFHRFGTISHILASLELFLFKICKKVKAGDSDDPVGLIKKFQNMKGIVEEEEAEVENQDRASENSLGKLGQPRKPKSYENLQQRFTKNVGEFNAMNPNRQSKLLQNVFPQNPEQNKRAIDRLSRLNPRFSENPMLRNRVNLQNNNENLDSNV